MFLNTENGIDYSNEADIAHAFNEIKMLISCMPRPGSALVTGFWKSMPFERRGCRYDGDTNNWKFNIDILAAGYEDEIIYYREIHFEHRAAWNIAVRQGDAELGIIKPMIS